MLKRTWSLLLVLALVTAPGVAFGAAPDREAPDRPGVIEWVWNGIARLLGIGGVVGTEDRESESPRRIVMGDEAGGMIDPNG